MVQQYYQKVAEKLKNCFEFNDYVIATGKELVQEGCDPSFPALTRPTAELIYLTKERGLQVHLPVIGKNSQSVLMPMDFEIYLSRDHYKLYADKETQKYYFSMTVPVIDFIKGIFIEKGIPFLLDYTPSGGHILFQNLKESRYAEELQKIGFLENDLISRCQEKIPGNLRRHNGIDLKAALMFSGLTKLAEYIAMLTIKHFAGNVSQGKLPVTVSDTADYCINLDNSWCEGSPYMRSIRSPFSLHKKNHETYNRFDEPPLVDVMACYFDGKELRGETSIDKIVDCMWDLELAAKHAEQFTGHIPCANDNLINLIEDYKKSDLYLFHSEFDKQEDLPHGVALEYAKKEHRVNDFTRQILTKPNPMAVQPINMEKLVIDFVINANWQAKHVANVLRDLYLDPNNKWTQDFNDLYPASEKSNFWARTFSANAYAKKGWLKV